MIGPRWSRHEVDTLRQNLIAAAKLHVIGGEPIRIWRLSGVERLHLADGSTVVFKYAVEPFTREAHILAILASHRIPVPALLAWAVQGQTVGMLMDDLGQTTREATDSDAAAAAVRLHATPPIDGLPTYDSTQLAALPQLAITRLSALRAQGRFTDTDDVTHLLHALAAVADRRAVGADLPPFGLCHGELHRTSLHVSITGWRLLDLGKAFNGPGLLDLATWFSTRTMVDPVRLDRLIHHYITAGGHPAATADRGGLPAAVWALGWHRVWSAAWFITHAALGHHHPNTDIEHTAIIRRQLAGAVALLTQTNATGKLARADDLIQPAPGVSKDPSWRYKGHTIPLP